MTKWTTRVTEGSCVKIVLFTSREINGVAMNTIERVLWTESDGGSAGATKPSAATGCS